MRNEDLVGKTPDKIFQEMEKQAMLNGNSPLYWKDNCKQLLQLIQRINMQRREERQLMDQMELARLKSAYISQLICSGITSPESIAMHINIIMKPLIDLTQPKTKLANVKSK